VKNCRLQRRAATNETNHRQQEIAASFFAPTIQGHYLSAPGDAVSDALFLPRELFSTPSRSPAPATSAPTRSANTTVFTSGEAVAADLLLNLTPVQTQRPVATERRRKPRSPLALGVDLYIA
jgi:hypothetical protein